MSDRHHASISDFKKQISVLASTRRSRPAAAGRAMSEMLDLMEVQLCLPRAEALALASSRIDLRITQIVNPLRGVHAVLADPGSRD